MAMTGIRYELRVSTRVSEATLAAFRMAVRPTVVPRNTVYRLRVPADRDLAEVLQLLTEREVQVLEIRRCAEPRRRDGRSIEAQPERSGVVVPFPRRPVQPGD